VTGELAVKFFEKSGLNPRILGEVRGLLVLKNILELWLTSRVLDLGDCRHRKSGAPHPDGVQCCSEVNRSSTSRPTPTARACPTSFVCHILILSQGAKC